MVTDQTTYKPQIEQSIINLYLGVMLGLTVEVDNDPLTRIDLKEGNSGAFWMLIQKY